MEKENIRSHGLELATILRQYEQEYKGRYPLCGSQRKAYDAIIQCRTSALGAHERVCDGCGYHQISYNSCRNRHCPKCQYLKQVLWVDKLKHRLLPTRYFHVVFTVPDFLNPLFYINQRACYDLLFKASSYALEKTTGNPAFLGAQSGHVSVLHTWGQSLHYHPHLHVLVPAGGLDADGQQWIGSRKKFFVPVVALSKIFRAKYYELLVQALGQQTLVIPHKDRELYGDIHHFKQRVYATLWHVHIKKTFKGAGQVVSYLGRYTHRVAISNNRLLSLQDNVVRFRWKDYRDNRIKIMELGALDFIRRFLQHILPCGYYKIRYFGIFSSVHSKTSLAQCFSLLYAARGCSQYEGLPMQDVVRLLVGVDPLRCTRCENGRMITVGVSVNAVEDS